MGLCFCTWKWCHHEDFGFVCVRLLELGVVVLMASAQVLPNSMAATRKLEHLEAGKRRVRIFLLSLSLSLLNAIQIFNLDWMFSEHVALYVFISKCRLLMLRLCMQYAG